MNTKEKQVFMLIANGYEPDEISKMLELSSQNIDSYQKKILSKLNAKTMPQAIFNYMSYCQSLGF